jgi:hemerythrin-like domain-containing protein
MKATDVLMEEHEVILRVIKALQKAVDSLPGGKVAPGIFLDAADFIKGFADGFHHAKEEGVLFPAMIAAGIPARDGPVAAMLAEHEQGRVLTMDMRSAAEKWQAGDASVEADVAVNAMNYATLLKAHIHKENCVLFPMADKVIPADKQDAVWEDFERVEHEETGAGVHEKYLALAEKIEKAVSEL